MNDYSSYKVGNVEDGISATSIIDISRLASDAKSGRGLGTTAKVSVVTHVSHPLASDAKLMSDATKVKDTAILSYSAGNVDTTAPLSGSYVQSNFLNSVLQVAEDLSNGAMDSRCSDCTGICVSSCVSGCADSCSGSCINECKGGCSNSCTTFDL